MPRYGPDGVVQVGYVQWRAAQPEVSDQHAADRHEHAAEHHHEVGIAIEPRAVNSPAAVPITPIDQIDAWSPILGNRLFHASPDM